MMPMPTRHPTQRPDELHLSRLVVALAMLLLALILLVATWLGLLARDDHRLSEVLQQQQPGVEAAQRARAGLDQLATGLQRLAADGNPNAKEALEALRKEGISLSLHAPDR